MKKIFNLLIVFCVALVCLNTPAVAVEFVEGLEDLPIMAGLEQIQNDNISFGNEQARFVEAYFSGKNLKYKTVAAFYKETLPQLGWAFISQKGNALHFERDMEVLDIVQEKASPLLVRITLKSKD